MTEVSGLVLRESGADRGDVLKGAGFSTAGTDGLAAWEIVPVAVDSCGGASHDRETAP